MKIRRERTHQSGLTNIDFRTKGELDKVDRYNGNLKFADFGSMNKSAYKRPPSAIAFKEQVAQSGGWLNSKHRNELQKNPKYETAAEFYASQGKKPKETIKIPVLRSAQLENTHWSGNIFTGDNKNTTAMTAFHVRQRQQEPGGIFNEEAIKKRLFQKSQSYQMKQTNIKPSLEDNIDIERIKAARKALRRKYAARNTIDKIFQKYDAGQKGFIDAQDLYDQANLNGITISLDEAQVLIQSAKQNTNSQEPQNNTLSVEEYANLLFSHDERINIDLKKLQSAVPKSNATQRSYGAPTDYSDYIGPRNIFEDEYVVLDQKKVPQNVLEQIEQRLIRMNRRLKKKFKDEASLSQKLNDELQPDCHGNVPVDKLKDFILQVCEQDLMNRNLIKRDIEGFLSAFNYNNYGATNIKDVSKLIFTKDDEIQNKLAERKRANPPPQVLSDEFKFEDSKEASEDPKIKKLLNQIEDKVFNGRVKLYQVFKQFDKDGDGYVSYDDFERSLSSLKLDVSRQDVTQIISLLDKNKNGYLAFQDFSKIFSPNMSSNLVKIPQNDSHLPNLAPSKLIVEQNLTEVGGHIEKVKQTTKDFEPSLQTKLIVATRFGAKPDFGSTFVNFQHPNISSGFISEKDRFAGTAQNFLKPKSVVGKNASDAAAQTHGTSHGHGGAIFGVTDGKLSMENSINSKVSFQREDKDRAARLNEARLNAKRLNQEILLDKKMHDTFVFDSKDQEKLLVKAARIENATIR